MFSITLLLIISVYQVSGQDVFNDAFLQQHCNFYQNVKYQCEVYKWSFPTKPICTPWSKEDCTGTYIAYQTVCTDYDCTVKNIN